MSGFDDFVARWRRSLAFPASEIDHFVDEHRHELETLYADERALRGGWPGSVADFLALERLARSERLLGGRSDDEALGHIKGVVARRGGGGRDHAVARALALALGREGWATIDLLNDRPLVAVFVDRELVAIVSATGRVAPGPGHERTAAPFEALVEHGLERIRAFEREVGPGAPLERFARALWTRARAGTLGSSPLQWFELYNPEGGVPVEESAGYRRALVAAEQVFESVLWVLDQPPIDLDVLPALDSLGSTRYDLELEEGDDEFGAAVSPDELPVLVGTDVYGWTPEETGDLIADVMDAESRGGYRSDALIKHEIARQIWLAEGRLELASIDKESACDFIAQHHSALPRCNPRGMLFAVAARLRGEVVAVATAGTPTGRWGSGGPCPVDGILELTRIASVGGLTRTDRRGRTVPVSASSALASRVIDLLPLSGRRGALGCRFVTYSLATEQATTYLSLVGKGLRPVARRRGKKPSGARGSASALPDVDKIVWEAGPAARPPDWTIIPEHRRAGAQRAFAQYQAKT